MPAMSWFHKLLFASRDSGTVIDGAGAQVQQQFGMSGLRYEMLLAVQACGELHRHRAVGKIHSAQTPLDLWQLRPEIYLYLARDLGQCEANQRMNALLPLFKGWAPEASAFVSRGVEAQGHGIH